MSKIVESVFKTHSKAQKVFTTSDGMPFTNEHNAKMHAKGLKDKKVTTHTRKAAVKAKAPAKQVESAEGLIEKIGAAASVKEIEALIPDGEKRKTVLAAVEAAKAKVEGDPDTTE